MKLNLGSGELGLEGYENLDIKTGDCIYPLDYKDIDEIRASHVLEHFSFVDIPHVLEDWAKALRPGGVLKIAVPNFEWIAKNYLAGNEINTQGYTMGGQVDENDYHKAIFDKEELTEALKKAGLRNIKTWKSSSKDCASLPVSLNLMGTKPSVIHYRSMNVGAAMSVPRLGFMENFFCSYNLTSLGIPIRKHTGAFWGQCLERCIDEYLSEDKDWILTIDYDTIFTIEHVETLLTLAHENPEADAIAPIQASRFRNKPLFTQKGVDGKNKAEILAEDFKQDLMEISTAHFGLTLLKVEKLIEMDRPLFWGKPGNDGKWDDSRVDDDIYFWNQWREAGNSLYLANRVAVGHAELMIRWPDKNLEATYQHPSEFYGQGEPPEVWE